MNSRIFKGCLPLTFCAMFSVQLSAQNNGDKIYLEDEYKVPVRKLLVSVKCAGCPKEVYVASDDKGYIDLSGLEYPVQMKIEDGEYKGVDTLLAKGGHTLTLTTNYNVLDQVVFTGVGRPTKVDEAVSVYQIISSEAIRAKGAVTLNEALRTEMGLNIGQDQMLGSNMSMRGLGGNNVKILIDGLPVNGRENGNIDLSQFNLNNIERIERVQGPMSVMYGSDALGGVINLITKKEKNKFTAGAQTYISTINQYNFSGNVGYSNKKHNVSLHAGRNYFHGWDPVRKVSETRSPLWRPKELLFGNFKYTYQLSPVNSISYALDFSEDNLVLKSDTAGFAEDPTARRLDTYIKTQRWINRLIGKFYIGKNGYLESNNSYAIYDRFRNGYLIDFTTMDKVPSPNKSDNTQITFNTVTSRTTYNNFVKQLGYTVGYDINMETGDGDDKIAAGRKTLNDYAVFMTLDYTLWSKLKIQPAVRASYNTVYKTPVIPSLGIRYEVNPRIKLRFNYAKGFRAPNLKELYLAFNDANHDITGNHNLVPEEGHHFQLSSAFTTIDNNKHNSVISFTGMYDDVRNQIMMGLTEVNPDPTVLPKYTYFNIAHLRYITLQLKNDYSYKNFRMELGASWNKNIATESVMNDGTVYATPDFDFFEINSNLSYAVKKYNLTFSGFYKYTGRQRILGADIMGGAIFGDYMKGFNMIDASIQKEFFKNRLAVIAGSRNLLNVQRLATGSGGAGGHGSSSSANITTGRSFFVNLRVQL